MSASASLLIGVSAAAISGNLGGGAPTPGDMTVTFQSVYAIVGYDAPPNTISVDAQAIYAIVEP
jgi:hypothetical protein